MQNDQALLGRASFSRSSRLATGAALIVAVSMLAGSFAAFGRVSAQSVECGVLKPVAFMATSASSPEASPVASPVSESDATPVAVAVAVADEVSSGQIDLLVRTIAACQSARRVKTLVQMVDESFLSDVYAGGGPITAEQFISLGGDLPKIPVTIVSIDDVKISARRRATADVTATIGNQLVHSRWSFIYVPLPDGDDTGESAGLGNWVATGVRGLPVEIPEDAKTVEITISKNTYDPDKIRVKGPDVVITATNKDRDDHELLVVSLAKDVSTQDLLSAPGAKLPKGVTVIGQVTIPAKGEGQLVLVELPKGTYDIVDLLPASDGTPHLALGMHATLTVK